MRTAIDLYGEWKKEVTEGGIRFVFPAREGAGIRPYGFDFVNDAAADVMRWHGFRFTLYTERSDTAVRVTAGFADGGSVSAGFRLADAGGHSCSLALEDFDVERAKSNIWRELVFVELNGELAVKSARLLKGKRIAVETGILGKHTDAGETAVYDVTVCSCSDSRQWVEASQVIEGWESMYADICPERFVLEPYGSCQVKVSVKMHDNIPKGAHEKTTVRFVPEGSSDRAEEVSFWTLRTLEHPYIYHTQEKWAETAVKIDREDVFQPAYEQLKKDADGWSVVPPVPFGERDYCYDTGQEHYIMSCAYLYSITKEQVYAEKLAAFFRYFTDSETGYPVRKKGCSQSYVQEGHFFQHLALAYDMIYDSGALTQEDHTGIEKSFRIYMEILDRHICCGHISNWTLSELTGAVYCAMALQDFERMRRFLFGSCGSFEQLSHGAFSDGWWYECSVGYNIWVSSMFLHTAHALLPFGINLIHCQFPLSYGKEVDSINKGEIRKIKHGMYNEKWGGVQKGYVCIKDLFDAVIPFLDERGVLFGINDSDEKKITGVHFGSTFDLAYTYYKDPAYIPIIRKFDMADPIFGHAHLPEYDENVLENNAYSDNIGIAMLRSRTQGRRAGEQIQAVLRYGSHGYAHGHFDRTELLSVMRYGRSFFNPEHLWWSYGHFMYKFYVQNSNTKNMVTVDGKMQIPADAARVLFYSGKRLQAAGVRTVSRWGFPPFGGMIYQKGESLKERCEYNASDLSSYDAAPYGVITGITEPVVQTRVMAVLDDCIVLFDSLCGETEHRYESLMQIKGFQSLEGAGTGSAMRYVRHTGKKSEDPRSDEQFITDCAWYEAEGETRAGFVTRYGEGADLRGMRGSYNEGGCLCMDVYTAWPLQTRQCVGLAAEDLGQKSPYGIRICSDTECVGQFGANPWLLGARRLDIALDPGSRTLKLEIENKPLYTEQMYPYDSPQCLFLADAFLETKDGRRISLPSLPVTCENIDGGYGIGKDYEGGRVLIEGEEYDDAVPISAADHSRRGIMEYSLDGLKAVRFTGIIGVDNFPGDEKQRRVTYGVAQTAVFGRFITVIEPHEGQRKVVRVEGSSENTVKIFYEDGNFQEVEVREINDAPSVTLRTYRNGSLAAEECTE